MLRLLTLCVLICIGIEALNVENLLKSSNSELDNLNGVPEGTKKTLRLAKQVYLNLNKSHEHDFKQFFTFVHRHKREYADESTLKSRFSKFQLNLRHIDQLNKEDNLATYGVTKFSDLSSEEFIKQATGNILGDKSSHSSSDELTSVKGDYNYPKNFDWRTDRGFQPIVMDQGLCDSSHVFTVIAIAEGSYFRTYNVSVKFSEQQVLSCMENEGCSGNTIENSLKNILDEGVDYADDYPYTNWDSPTTQACIKDKAQYGVINIYRVLRDQPEEQIKQWLYWNSPIAVIIDAKLIQHYKKGIIGIKQPYDCSMVNHGAVIMGYGENEPGVPYWTLKNSYGTNWGEGGYFRIVRNQSTLQVNCQAAYAATSKGRN
ncbi:unnamed protein product [Bursaphelenchus okinawaensis]|uniref:Uncharacterized protein n=1 Tax=Bursaphelenchus okinawaensis TaxID=465554 RepID=A0A811L9F5_9BILA|nr:unnamed protein product [Bursaphelenchus okinawaensis]CAG9121505.1 unnamed protein product [Bursaphelenchus okinawaensis]